MKERQLEISNKVLTDRFQYFRVATIVKEFTICKTYQLSKFHLKLYQVEL
jgi:hypothetical protein